MIEVRSFFLTRTRDIEVKDGALDSCKELREKIWPAAEWQGRIQQMLIGHAQQGLFVLSSQWENLAAWEAGMVRLKSCPEYQKWIRGAGPFWTYGEANEILTVLEGEKLSTNLSGAIEVRSAYIVQARNMEHAKKLAHQRPSRLQNTVFLYDNVSQSLFVFSSMWENLASWEQAMDTAEDQEFETWYKKWMKVVEFGGPKEVFRNL